MTGLCRPRTSFFFWLFFFKTLNVDLRHWLSKQPSYNASREFDVGTARSGGMDIENVDSEAEEGDASGRRRAIAFLPSLGNTLSHVHDVHNYPKVVAK